MKTYERPIEVKIKKYGEEYLKLAERWNSLPRTKAEIIYSILYMSQIFFVREGEVGGIPEVDDLVRENEDTLEEIAEGQARILKSEMMVDALARKIMVGEEFHSLPHKWLGKFFIDENSTPRSN